MMITACDALQLVVFISRYEDKAAATVKLTTTRSKWITKSIYLQHIWRRIVVQRKQNIFGFWCEIYQRNRVS